MEAAGKPEETRLAGRVCAHDRRHIADRRLSRRSRDALSTVQVALKKFFLHIQ